jgi:hypothetical protein
VCAFYEEENTIFKKLSFKGKRWALFSTGAAILTGILARSTMKKSLKKTITYSLENGCLFELAGDHRFIF